MNAIVKKAPRATTPKVKDATALLRADHKEVSDLFDEFEKTKSASKKKAIVTKVCKALTGHAQIEEEIFYPAFKAAVKDKELIPEATVEHQTLKDLIAQIEGVEPDGEIYDAKVKVLSEYVKHHVKEEQNEIFPKAKSATKLDLVQLGAQLLQRKQELLAGIA